MSPPPAHSGTAPAPVAIDPPERRTTHARFVVNGEPRDVSFAPNKTLLEVLREELALPGTKHGCELGECGTCTVVIDGMPALSCLALAAAHDGARIETVEGMSAGARLHPLQEAFADLGAAQCGYCTPGFLLTARALLDENPHPTRAEIVDALSGNLCRCTGYLKIYEAVERAAAVMRDAMRGEGDAPRTADEGRARDNTPNGAARHG
ncbi:MAG TPA: (2Fe-2S)-binding protein [Gemmatimonadaceae bacterium]|nr:(2Fe-2S)-binding protein [Gemmatimonadaceae bacterium]